MVSMKGVNSDTSQCSTQIKPSDNSTIFPNANPYGGIPTNLTINAIGFVILLLVFLIIRRNAWKALNKIVRKDDVERVTNQVTHMFFSFTTVFSNHKETEDDEKTDDDDDIDSIISPGTEDTNIRSSLGGQSREKDGYGNSESGLIETRSYYEDELQDKAKKSMVEGNVSNEDRIGEATETSRKSDGNYIVADEGVTYDDEIKVLGPNPIDTSSVHEDEQAIRRRRRMPRQVSTISDASEKNKSFREWFTSIFTMSDVDIINRCGLDALQYLRFQRHIICYVTMTMVLSISIILPLNFQGNLAGNETDFEHTTLGNLEADSNFLWAHISLAFFLFPLSILFMRRFSVDLRFTQLSLEMSRTLLIENIPKNLCRSTEEVKRYFVETFPTTEIAEIKFAYNVKKLEIVNEKINEVKSALNYCIKRGQLNSSDVPTYPQINVDPRHCTRFCGCFCFCCSSKLDAMDYYGDEKQNLLDEFEKEKNEALKNPLGIGFVTFKTYQMSKDVHDAFKKTIFTCWKAKLPQSSLSSILRPEYWSVSYAPVPDDIYWENLGSSRFWWIKYTLANTALFIFLLFLSTPTELVTQINELSKLLHTANIDDIAKALQLPPVIANFLPTLLLLGFTALLPLLVTWSDRFLGHWTRSQENHAIMKKTFWYLVFMVILLPTFGFTSMLTVLETVLSHNSTDEIEWECIFLPDSGAFFVNYLITAALFGCAMELLRIPELLWYYTQLCWSRSKAETPYIRTNLSVYEFRFGEQYARMMMLFCMTMLYSISCPLITPFGVLYFVLKHYVDRHNLLYAYKPSKINKKVHATAINFVILSTVLLQFFMMMFTLIRGGTWRSLSTIAKCSILFFFLSCNIYFAQLWEDSCKKCSPIDYVENTIIKDDINDEDRNRIYCPFTLMDDDEKGKYLANKKRIKKSILQRNEYGTF